jgi:exosortase/archaeosortase
MKLFYFSFLFFTLLSCSSNDDAIDNCLEYKTAGIETVTEKPNTDAFTYPFDVGFRVINGCGAFDSFVENTVGSVTIIEVIALYNGCICTQDAPLRETVYTFTANAAGTYTLNFKMGNGSSITKTITIE